MFKNRLFCKIYLNKFSDDEEKQSGGSKESRNSFPRRNKRSRRVRKDGYHTDQNLRETELNVASIRSELRRCPFEYKNVCESLIVHVQEICKQCSEQ